MLESFIQLLSFPVLTYFVIYYSLYKEDSVTFLELLENGYRKATNNHKFASTVAISCSFFCFFIMIFTWG